MQFYNLIAAVLMTGVAAASPTVNLYSDGDCKTVVRTVALQNYTCVAYANGFGSVKVTANPEVAVVYVYTGTSCGSGTLTKAFFPNNASVCNNGFQNGPGKSLVLHEAS